MTDNFYSLCRSLLQAIDAGNSEAEESVLCRIRVAVREAGRELETSNIQCLAVAHQGIKEYEEALTALGGLQDPNTSNFS